MNRIFAIAVLGALLSAVPLLSADVYVWTDENGVKHYSNVAPSENADEIDKDKELKSNNTSDSASPAPRAFNRSRSTNAPAPPRTADAKGDETEAKPDPQAEAEEALRLDLKKFPVPQDELVQREKTIVSGLKKELGKSGTSREDVIAKEEQRLLKAIQVLEEAPLEKFGSQKNKIRQVGYYKYRLDALLNSPDAYFDYGESDAD